MSRMSPVLRARLRRVSVLPEAKCCVVRRILLFPVSVENRENFEV